MQSDITVSIQKLQKELAEIPGKMPARILSTAAVASARVIVKHVKTPGFAFNDRSGRLRRTVKARRERVKPRTTNASIAAIGAGRGPEYARVILGSDDAFYALWVELGHAGSRGRRGAKARAPLHKARDETTAEQEAALRKKADDEVHKLVRELKSGKIRPVTARVFAG